jgi:hypothetical protein
MKWGGKEVRHAMVWWDILNRARSIGHSSPSTAPLVSLTMACVHGYALEHSLPMFF